MARTYKIQQLPRTEKETIPFRKKLLRRARTAKVKSNEELQRSHPLIQLFLSARVNPDAWRFWYEKEFIWAQERDGKRWIGSIHKLRPDGVWELKSSRYGTAVQ